jgi:hypothetical protein
VSVDSTGLKVCGQGAWHAQRHGEKKRKHWRKRPRGVDEQGRIMAWCVTDGHEQAPAPVPELLSHIEREIDRFVGDGIDDQAPVYAAVVRHAPGAQVSIPPRKEAVVSPEAATAPPQRDQPMTSIEGDGLFAWKRSSGDDAPARAENAFLRYKRTFGSH